MANSWFQIGNDGISGKPHFVDPSIHTAYYFRSYASEDGVPPWEWGEDGEGQDMVNFKRSPQKTRSNRQWRDFKNIAAKKFADDLTGFLRSELNLESPTCITHMPGSKNPHDEEYDNYLERVVKYAVRNFEHITHEPIFYQNENRESMHSGEFTRDPRALKAGWSLHDDLDLSSYREIIIVDDMITAGTSIRASYEFLNEQIPDCPKITHIAWMRKIWNSPSDVFKLESD